MRFTLLLIIVKAKMEVYNEFIVEDVIWIRENYNLADAIAKHLYYHNLIK